MVLLILTNGITVVFGLLLIFICLRNNKHNSFYFNVFLSGPIHLIESRSFIKDIEDIL